MCHTRKKEQYLIPALLLFHCFLVLSSLLNLADGRFLHRDTAVFVITELYDNGIISNINNDTIETGSGQNAVTCL